MSSSKRKPEPVGAVLKKLLSSLGIDEAVKQHQAIAVWEQCVGEAIAKVTVPERIEHGRLFVRVENSAWKQELHFFKKDIISRINVKLEKNTVKDIIFV